MLLNSTLKIEKSCFIFPRFCPLIPKKLHCFCVIPTIIGKKKRHCKLQYRKMLQKHKSLFDLVRLVKSQISSAPLLRLKTGKRPKITPILVIFFFSLYSLKHPFGLSCARHKTRKALGHGRHERQPEDEKDRTARSAEAANNQWGLLLSAYHRERDAQRVFPAHKQL